MKVYVLSKWLQLDVILMNSTSNSLHLLASLIFTSYSQYYVMMLQQIHFDLKDSYMIAFHHLAF